METMRILFASVLILIFGPGKFALDVLLKYAFTTNAQHDAVYESGQCQIFVSEPNNH
jgi:hypothetical protein